MVPVVLVRGRCRNGGNAGAGCDGFVIMAFVGESTMAVMVLVMSPRKDDVVLELEQEPRVTYRAANAVAMKGNDFIFSDIAGSERRLRKRRQAGG